MEFPDTIETPWEHADTSKSVGDVHVKSASVDPVQDAVAPATRTGDAGTKRKRVQKLRTWRSSGEASAAQRANDTMEESSSIVDHDHHAIGAVRDVDSGDILSDDDLPPTKEAELDKETVTQKQGKQGPRIRGKETWSSKDEEEEMWEAVMDRSKAVQGPPTAAHLDHLLATYITLTQNGELVSTSLQNGLWSGNFADSNIRIGKSGKLSEYKGKQWYCGQYLTAEEAARATDKMKLKGLLCGWQPHLNKESGRYTCTMNFHPQVYLDEMSLPEVVAMTNPSPYRYLLMEQAKLSKKARAVGTIKKNSRKAKK